MEICSIASIGIYDNRYFCLNNIEEHRCENFGGIMKLCRSGMAVKLPH